MERRRTGHLSRSERRRRDPRGRWHLRRAVALHRRRLPRVRADRPQKLGMDPSARAPHARGRQDGLLKKLARTVLPHLI